MKMMGSTLRCPAVRGTANDIGEDLRSIKEMGVDHVISGVTDPDLDRVIDNAKQISKFA